MRFHLLLLALLVWLLLPASSAWTQVNLSKLIKAMDEANRREFLAEQEELLRDTKIVRPTPKEQDAITKLIEQKPRPKTLNDADIKWLKSLLDKVTWLGAERRVMHEIWEEATGKNGTPRMAMLQNRVRVLNKVYKSVFDSSDSGRRTWLLLRVPSLFGSRQKGANSAA